MTPTFSIRSQFIIIFNVDRLFVCLFRCLDDDIEVVKGRRATGRGNKRTRVMLECMGGEMGKVRGEKVKEEEIT